MTLDRVSDTPKSKSAEARAPARHPVLPSESSLATRWRALFVDVGIVIAMVIGTNFALRYWLDATDRDARLIADKWSRIETHAAVDTVIIGDSSGNQGVSAGLLGKELSGGALNLCTVGDLLLLDDAWMLASYVERHGPPKRVVLVHTHDIWQRSARHFLPWLAVIPKSADELSALEPHLDIGWRDRVRTWMHRWLPLYSRPYRTRILLTSPSAWTSSPPTVDADGYQEIDDARPEAVAADLAEQLRFLTTTDYSMSSLNRAALTSILAIADRYHFPVYFAPAPLVREFAEQEAFARYRQQWLDDLATVRVGASRVAVLFAEPPTFEADHMDAVDHVVGAAAIAFTIEIARAIAVCETTTRTARATPKAAISTGTRPSPPAAPTAARASIK